MLGSMDAKYQQMKDLRGIDQCLRDSSESETDAYILRHNEAKRIAKENLQI